MILPEGVLLKIKKEQGHENKKTCQPKVFHDIIIA